MTKTEKRLDKAIRTALTSACENLKDISDNFLWLTHTADLKRLPLSMKVSCYFAEQMPLSNSPLANQINQVIIKELKEIDVVISAKAILFCKD
ncbi:hypothetical protein [Pseudoalteromonas sp. L1]|uniref:hypothetical protein n=1 Tax=Pseudoalteromonas sp. L1 TaxID=195716 RepID=UPI001F1BB175|nr:hypothetical protein [Pseudoalteromonas sp. L1]